MMTGGLLALYVRARPLKDGLRMLQVLRRLSSCLFSAAGLRGSRCEQGAARHTDILCTQSRNLIKFKQQSDSYRKEPGSEATAERGRSL